VTESFIGRREVLNWPVISRAPKQPGLYAWYYSIELTEIDVAEVISTVDGLLAKALHQEARSILQSFLNEFVFRFFAEEDYTARIRGPLKPMYEGRLSHTPAASSDLIDRLLEDPDRLMSLKAVLEASVPLFASPIYIGMAVNLYDRLMTHIRLIEAYRTKRRGRLGSEHDQNFARRVVERGMDPTLLKVAVAPMPAETDEYIDAENVLNRISYPILGRN